ncbi:MAG: Bug family tripartite tricarboxylate transporter substrate binding protein [Xanthobacteraceae bacterium]|jgi:tripartite-type tricarboxylate transporter receptor subunit TctC
MQQFVFIVGAILAVAANPDHASAQDYPNRTVRIVVPYAPGGGVSLLAQTVGNKMSELMKQPVIVDNRPGAGGNLGADVVAKSAPDGYTLLLHTSAMSSASSLYSKLPFDPVKEFAPVSMVIATQFVIGGSPKNPATNLRELIALAREKPDAYNFGSSGPGSSLHLFAELFISVSGIKLVHVPYRGDAQIVTALAADDVQLAFLPQANGIAGVQGNLIRGLGVTGTRRMGALPDVPTALEQGINGLEVGSWIAMFAPAGTPPAIVSAVQQYLAQALADPKVREWLMSTGQEAVGNSPAEFAAQFKADIARFAKVVETAKIPKLD